MSDGTPEPIREAHERALEGFFGGDFEHLPDAVREELEALGIEPEDLEPSAGGIRGGLWREDVPRAVAVILEGVDAPVEISIWPTDGHHWEVEWNRLEPDDWGSWGEFRRASEEVRER